MSECESAWIREKLYNWKLLAHDSRKNFYASKNRDRFVKVSSWWPLKREESLINKPDITHHFQLLLQFDSRLGNEIVLNNKIWYAWVKLYLSFILFVRHRGFKKSHERENKRKYLNGDTLKYYVNYYDSFFIWKSPYYHPSSSLVWSLT